MWYRERVVWCGYARQRGEKQLHHVIYLPAPKKKTTSIYNPPLNTHALGPLRRFAFLDPDPTAAMRNKQPP
jgi:hypothetical protein